MERCRLPAPRAAAARCPHNLASGWGTRPALPSRYTLRSILALNAMVRCQRRIAEQMQNVEERGARLIHPAMSVPRSLSRQQAIWVAIDPRPIPLPARETAT